MGKYIAVRFGSKIEIHFTGLGSYATMCGLDGNDSVVDQFPSKVPNYHKVDCLDCIAIFEEMRKYTRKDIYKKGEK